MNTRRHGSKPAVGLWMLVAVADVALLAATAGPLMLLLIVALAVTVAGGFVGARMLGRRDTRPTEVAVRRRA